MRGFLIAADSTVVGAGKTASHMLGVLVGKLTALPRLSGRETT
jgi:hypothetical protein